MKELLAKHKKKIIATVLAVLASLGAYLSVDTKEALKDALDGAPAISEIDLAPAAPEAPAEGE